MKFSVIIPIYNSAPFLRRCLDSLLIGNEKFAADGGFELVLIDDGSTDESPDICLEYAEKYPNIKHITQKNAGPAAARNKGISVSEGKYLTFVDSDDAVSSDFFCVLDKATDTTDIDMIIFGIRHIGKDGEILHAYPAKKIEGREQIVGFLAQNHGSGDLNSSANKVFSHALFRDGSLRYPAGTVVEEDLIFVLRGINLSESLLSLNEGLYLYQRRESGSVTTKYNPIKFDCKLNAYREEIEWAKMNDSQSFVDIFNESYLTYISSCINNLLYAACPLDRKAKLDEIRRFYSAEETKECIKNVHPSSMRGKIMRFLIKHQLIHTSYFIHYVIFHAKGR